MIFFSTESSQRNLYKRIYTNLGDDKRNVRRLFKFDFIPRRGLMSLNKESSMLLLWQPVLFPGDACVDFTPTTAGVDPY